MAKGLVKLVKTAVPTISLVALLSCNPPSGPSYSSTPNLPDPSSDVPGAVLPTPEVRDSTNQDLDILAAPMPIDTEYNVIKPRGQDYLIIGGVAVKQPERYK